MLDPLEDLLKREGINRRVERQGSIEESPLAGWSPRRPGLLIRADSAYSQARRLTKLSDCPVEDRFTIAEIATETDQSRRIQGPGLSLVVGDLFQGFDKSSSQPETSWSLSKSCSRRSGSSIPSIEAATSAGGSPNR